MNSRHQHLLATPVLLALAAGFACGETKVSPAPEVVPLKAGGAGAAAGGATGAAAGGATAKAGENGNAGQGGTSDSAGRAGTAGTGDAGAAGQAGASGESAGGTAGQGGGGAVGVGGKTTTCPDGPGPKMVLIDVPGTPAFCIDSTEVTQAQYLAFLQTKPDVTKQSRDFCLQLNQSFEPPVLEEGVPGGCWKGGPFTGKENPNAAMTCVNWCDAIAYCEWAGKRLCGKIGGGGQADWKASPDSQWQFVCSQGGKTKFPYGDTFQAGVCTSSDPGALSKPVGEGPCRGQSTPFDSVYGMSGGVAEWLDGCDAGPPVVCRHAGGASDTPEPETACTFGTGSVVNEHSLGRGFRCCAD